MPRVLVTRAPHQASALAVALQALGCEPVLIPTIELAPPASFEALDGALAHLNTYHWLIFTSANAVGAFAQRAMTPSAPQPALSLSKGLDSELRAERQRPLIAAIGAATARALESIGLQTDLIPPQAIAESLTTALIPHALQHDGTPTRFLLIRAESARDHLPDALTAAGAKVTIAPVYRTIIPEPSITLLKELLHDSNHCPDAITFTSSSTATNLIALLEVANLELPLGVIRASIGPITSQTLREFGLPPHIEAPEATVESLARSLAACLQR